MEIALEYLLTLTCFQCEKNAVDDLLASLFQPLDWELYALVQGPMSDQDMLFTALIIDQTGTTEAPNAVRPLPNLRSVTVIDRIADVEKAAQHILSAHLAFSGRSPHAPDLIIINEWVKDKFIDTMARESLNKGRDMHSSHADAKHTAWKKAVSEAESKGEATLIRKEGLNLVDIHQR
jgi:hypothetical protein